MPEPLGLSPQQIKEIEEKLRLCLKEKSSWNVDVFGSRRRGDFKVYSDLDLWIDSKPSLTEFEMATLREQFEESELPIKIDIVTNESVLEDYRAHISGEKVNWLKS